jgi:hypothetical protein
MFRPTEFIKIMNRTEICLRFSDLFEEIYVSKRKPNSKLPPKPMNKMSKV